MRRICLRGVSLPLFSSDYDGIPVPPPLFSSEVHILLMVMVDAIAIFFNSLGGAFSISIAQNIFSNTLIQEIPKHTTGVSPATIIKAGATHVRDVTPSDQLQGVLQAYDLAINRAFILPIAVGALAFGCSLFVSSLPFPGLGEGCGLS